MKKTVANKWVKALRSGKYEQGKLYLLSNGSYCCLGVLCEIAPKSLKIEKYIIENNANFDGNASLLPEKVQKWAAMYSEYGDNKKVGAPSLASMNDSGSWNFEEIADYIEENWENL